MAVLATVAACSDGELILQGERLGVRSDITGDAGETAVPLDATLPAATPVSLPGQTANAEWTHRGGSAQHRIGNAALGASVARIWSANVGQGDNRKHRISADPVVAGGRVYTLDSRATVTATSTGGGVVWSTDLTPASDRADDASGGGIAYGGGRVFVTTGFGELVALDAASGAVAWRQALPTAVGGAPAVEGGMVFVVARDATALGLSAENGRVRWQIAGTPAQAGVAGVSAPAAEPGRVVFPFASGQMIAVDPESGTGLWAANVAGRRLGRAYASVSDLTGDPVLAGDIVYAGSAAGRLSAVDAGTGTVYWTAPDGAVSPPVVAGDAIFIVNDEDQLVRLDAATGDEVWRVDLPYFTKERDKRRRTIFAHYGPILAGGRLWTASTDGLLRGYDPTSGAVVSQVEIPGGAGSAPVVAGGTLYVHGRNGQLHAFR